MSKTAARPSSRSCLTASKRYRCPFQERNTEMVPKTKIPAGSSRRAASPGSGGRGAKSASDTPVGMAWRRSRGTPRRWCKSSEMPWPVVITAAGARYRRRVGQLAATGVDRCRVRSKVVFFPGGQPGQEPHPGVQGTVGVQYVHPVLLRSRRRLSQAPKLSRPPNFKGNTAKPCRSARG